MSGWYWASEDDGVCGPLPTRREVIAEVGGAPVIERYSYGPGAFEYVFGFPGEERAAQWYIFTAESRFGYMIGKRADEEHINRPFWVRAGGQAGRTLWKPRCSCGWEHTGPVASRAGANRRYLDHLRDIA